MSKLITASLIGSIDWLNNSPPDWREKARADLVRQLARRWDPKQSLPQERGIKFEGAVYAKSAPRVTSTAGSAQFRWFVDECRGGVFQKKMRKIVTIDDVEYCLYGKADAWFPNIIKDIKTTENWRGDKHYLDGFQHKLYCYMEHIADFVYLVAEFLPGDMTTIVATHAVTFHVDDFDSLQLEVFNKVCAVRDFIDGDEELKKLYHTTFSMY